MALACAAAITAGATRQVQDRLDFNGQTYEFGGYFDFPLEAYFDAAPETVQHRKDELLKGTPQSTGCYRGYVATWFVESNTLYLTQIEIGDRTHTAEALKPIFGDRVESGRLQAFWFNGPILLRGKGPLIEKQEKLYRSDDWILVFEKGRVSQTYQPASKEMNQLYDKLKKESQAAPSAEGESAPE